MEVKAIKFHRSRPDWQIKQATHVMYVASFIPSAKVWHCVS